MTILSRCLDLLTENGPLPLETLAALAAGAGVTRAADPVTAVRGALSGRPFQVLLRDDGVCVPVRSLLTGRVFTHRLQCPGSDSDRLPVGADMPALVAVARDGLPLVNGGVVRSGQGFPGDHLRGPKGWLREHEAGTVLAFRLLPEGLDVQAVQLGPDEEARGEELRRLLEPQRVMKSWPWYGWRDLTRELLVLLDDDPQLLREPVPPLGELLREDPPPSKPDREDGRSPQQVRVRRDVAEVLSRAADELDLTADVLADALLRATVHAGAAAAAGDPGGGLDPPLPPADAGAWELQWYR